MGSDGLVLPWPFWLKVGGTPWSCRPHLGMCFGTTPIMLSLDEMPAEDLTCCSPHEDSHGESWS